MAEQLAASAKVCKNEKASTYDAIASTLRDNLNSPKKQFKAYFVALLADKEFAKVLDTVAKVDKLFKPPTQRSSLPSPSPRPRIYCYSCGATGHIASRCFKRNARPYPPSRPLMDNHRK